jgi:hypothetical protein
MSDDAKDEQAAAAAAGDGFTPAPPPPALSAEEAAAATASMSGDTVLPDGTIAVPQDTAKRALEAVQILVENNRSASQQLESLMGIVLDAAEVANRSASAVATTGTHVNKAAEKLIDGAKKTSMQAKVVLALAAAVLVGTAGTFSFMTVQLHSKVEQLDEMLLAVGKRAVDLKRRMETMDDIHAALEELNLKQENTQSVQQAIEDKIARLVDSGKLPTRKETTATPAEAPAPAPAKPAPQQKSEKPAKPEQKSEQKPEQKAERTDKSDANSKTPPTSTAKAVSPKKSASAKSESDEAALLQQLSGLDALIKEQSRAMRDLSSQVNNLQGSVATVDVIKKDVESIAAQQKQREKEAAQREKEAAQELAAANARREKEIKDKERELARERERAREREATRERELAREREAAKERELARERELAKERDKGKDKERAVSYNREQSKPNAAASVDGVPSYSKPASKTE